MGEIGSDFEMRMDGKYANQKIVSVCMCDCSRILVECVFRESE